MTETNDTDDDDQEHWESVEYDLSASRLKTHASCPKKYELKYILGYEGTKGANGYGQMGSWVHETIENVLLQNPNERDEQVLHSKLKQEFVRLEQSDEVTVDAVDKDQRSTALDCLEVVARYIASQEFTLEGVEVAVNFEIDNPQLQKTAYGKIDVVTEKGEIWDWKSGSINEDYTPRDELIQGCIYMAGYHHKYGNLPKAIKFVYIKEEKVREIDPTQESWQKMIQYGRELTSDEATGEFPAKPQSGKCYFCDYEMYCPDSEVGVGGVNEQLANGEDMWDAI